MEQFNSQHGVGTFDEGFSNSLIHYTNAHEDRTLTCEITFFKSLYFIKDFDYSYACLRNRLGEGLAV